MKRKLTDAGARGTGAGAATTRPASKPRVSRAMRLVGWDISLAGVLPVPWVHIYMRPKCTDHSAAGNLCGISIAHALWLISLRQNVF